MFRNGRINYYLPSCNCIFNWFISLWCVRENCVLDGQAKRFEFKMNRFDNEILKNKLSDFIRKCTYLWTFHSETKWKKQNSNFNYAEYRMSSPFAMRQYFWEMFRLVSNLNGCRKLDAESIAFHHWISELNHIDTFVLVHIRREQITNAHCP